MNPCNHPVKIGSLRPGHRPCCRGMTLLELTVVIAVMLSLITLLFYGARAWKRGSDRAVCIMNIQNTQKGLRSYSNLNALEPGANIPGLKNLIIGFGRFVQVTPNCPSGGIYTYGEDVIPPFGTLYIECSLSGSERHTPKDFSDW